MGFWSPSFETGLNGLAVTRVDRKGRNVDVFILISRAETITEDGYG